MTEEIKEILDNLELVSKKQYGVEELFDDDMIGALYNYITNLQREKSDICKNRLAIAIERDRLQQENERLKQSLFKSANNTNKAMEQTEIYKSRCEKAIEYINFVINHYKEQLETPIEYTYFDSDVNRKGYILSIIAYLQTILDTLIGSDEK